MAYKIYKKGNIVFVENTVNGLILQDGSANVNIERSNATTEKFLISSKRIRVIVVEFSDIQDENGDAYTDIETFETWRNNNTSFNPATSASVAEDIQNLADHEANETDAHDLTNRLVVKADLVGGVVPASQLPSYVDDVLEYANSTSFPVTGESGKIYVTIDTKLCYRWTGSVYAEISTQDLTPYQLKSEKNVVSGYIGIDSDGVAQIGGTTATGADIYGTELVAKIEKNSGRTHVALIGNNSVDDVSASIAGYDRTNGSLNKKRIWQLSQSVVSGANAGCQLILQVFKQATGVVNGGLIFRDNGDVHLSGGNFTSSNFTGVKSDVGLSNVDNTSDTNKPVSTAQATAIGVVQDDIDTHEANVSNPHLVTKTQVGLGNVPNVDATTTANITDSTGKRFQSENQNTYNDATSSIQTQINSKQASLGFTAENVANKSTTLSVDQASNTKYPSVKSVFDWATGLFATITNLALKANIDSPTFTGTVTKDVTVNIGYTVAQMVALSHVENKRIWNSELKDFFTSISGAWLGDRIVTLTNNSGATINVNEWVLPDSANDLSVVLSIVTTDGTKAIGWCAKTATTGNLIYIDGCRLFTTIASQATTRGQYIVNSAVTAGRTFTSATAGSRIQGIALTAAAANGNTYIGAKIAAEIF